ncbi:MAG TPA: phosphotransferase [Mycobacteriales bacterium]|nr:phosphotransferase [Mycobacteriales bacterium]
MTENRHPLVRAWIRQHPNTPFYQAPDDPAVLALADRLGFGPALRDLGGEDNLSLLLGSRRHVLRTYKPFISRRRVLDLQRVRADLAAAGLTAAVPLSVDGASVFRCGPRWAEVEPFLDLPSGGTSSPELFHGLGRLHSALARIPPPASRDLRRSFVDAGTLRRWVGANVVDGLVAGDTAEEVGRQIDQVESRWIDPGGVQLVHADPHAGNILAAGADDYVYLDFTGIEVAPRVHDVAMALMYQMAGSDHHEIPELLDAYSAGAGNPLTDRERAALPACAAAIALYYDICGWASGWRAIGERLLTLG